MEPTKEINSELGLAWRALDTYISKVQDRKKAREALDADDKLDRENIEKLLEKVAELKKELGI